MCSGFDFRQAKGGMQIRVYEFFPKRNLKSFEDMY